MTDHQLHPLYNRICKNCGLTYGAHRADSICHDQCPDHQGRMDWSTTHITTFVDSGELGNIPFEMERKQ
jgi:hypothetical protein